MGPVEIITSVQRQRQRSPAEKKAIVEDTEQPGMSISAVARKYGLHPNQLFTWSRLMHEGALSAVGAGEAVIPVSEAAELRFRICEWRSSWAARRWKWRFSGMRSG